MANDLLNTEIINAAKGELGGLVAENIDKIMKSYQEAIEDHESDTKFTFQVPCGLILSPDNAGIKVRAKIGWGVKHTDESVGEVASIEPTLFDKKGKDKS